MPGVLNHSPADVIRHLLVDLGVGAIPADEADWPIFTSQETDAPDNQIVTYDTNPFLDGRVQNSGEVQEHHGVMIQVRSANHVTGFGKIYGIGVVLDTEVRRNKVTILDSTGTASSTYIIHNASRQSGPISLGTEAPTSSRLLFTINYLVSLRLLH